MEVLRVTVWSEGLDVDWEPRAAEIYPNDINQCLAVFLEKNKDMNVQIHSLKETENARSQLKLDHTLCYTDARQAFEETKPEIAILVVSPMIREKMIDLALEYISKVCCEKLKAESMVLFLVFVPALQWLKDPRKFQRILGVIR